MDNQEKLVKEYLNAIALRLSADYGLSFEVATRAIEDLDLLNIYKDDYDFLLHEDISTWGDIAYQKYITEEFPDESGKVVRIAFEGPAKEENLKNKTIVKPQSNHILVYDEKPTPENTKYGDVVLYENEVWLNEGNNIFTSIPLRDLDGYIDKDGTIFKKPLTKDYVDEKVKEVSKENTMENYIVINGKKVELTEEQLNYWCMFNRFTQMAKEQFGLTITLKETAGETFKTLFGIDFSDCSKRNNPFERRYGNKYYKILENGSIPCDIDSQLNMDNISYKNVNYFNDSDFANQVYLHELLNRKLLKYAYDNEAEDVEWDGDRKHYFIYRQGASRCFFDVSNVTNFKRQEVYFSKREIAEQAIKDIVKPFMEEHPEFVW